MNYVSETRFQEYTNPQSPTRCLGHTGLVLGNSAIMPGCVRLRIQLQL